MSKPVTGKTHVGERRERRPNGDVYLYERVTAYNEQAKKTYTVSQKLKGKIKSGTQEVITTRPKKRKGEEAVACAVRKHSGLTDILEWVGTASGIDDDVRSSFSEGDAAKILSIARYWIGSEENTLPRLEGWQVMHTLHTVKLSPKTFTATCSKVSGATRTACSTTSLSGRIAWANILCWRSIRPRYQPTPSEHLSI